MEFHDQEQDLEEPYKEVGDNHTEEDCEKLGFTGLLSISSDELISWAKMLGKHTIQAFIF